MQLIDNFSRSMPLWLIFVFTVVIVLLSVYIGYKVGNYVYRISKDGAGSSAGSVVAASLGLLAFMLAFTFGIAANRFDARKQIVLDEVNTIGTTYLRANILPEPPRTKVRKILRDYVDERAALVSKNYWNKPDKIQQLIDSAEAKQDQLWSYAEDLGRQYPDSEIVSLFISSLNDMIDLHTKRIVVVLEYHIPAAIWGALYLLSVLSFGLIGYEIGISGGGNVFVSLIIALIFSTVIILIMDLDRPMQGYIVVSQKPMIQLQQKLNLESH
jgi:hypothetical protein